MKLPSTPRRVVVTGMAAISPIGSTWEEVRASLRANKSGIRHMTEWEKLEDLNTPLLLSSILQSSRESARARWAASP